MFNPIIRGWLTYYGRYYPSGLYPTLQYLDRRLARWAEGKYGSSAESVGEMQPVDLTGWCPALGKPRVFHSPTGPTNADPF